MYNWLPKSRVKQLAMVKMWIDSFQTRGEKWEIPTIEVLELERLFNKAYLTLTKAMTCERTADTTEECQRAFKPLTEKMIHLKENYLKNPPISEEDLNLLLTPIPNEVEKEEGEAFLWSKKAYVDQMIKIMKQLS